MQQTLKQNLPVLTADEYQLGQAHTVYHRQEKARPEKGLFGSYLKVVNLTIGDDYYVPLAYIDDEKGIDTAVPLTLTRDDIKTKQLTRLPQFVADNRFTEEKLDKATVTASKGKPMNKTMPLPPNLRVNPEEKESAAEVKAA